MAKLGVGGGGGGGGGGEKRMDMPEMWKYCSAELQEYLMELFSNVARGGSASRMEGCSSSYSQER